MYMYIKYAETNEKEAADGESHVKRKLWQQDRTPPKTTPLSTPGVSADISREITFVQYFIALKLSLHFS